MPPVGKEKIVFLCPPGFSSGALEINLTKDILTRKRNSFNYIQKQNLAAHTPPQRATESRVEARQRKRGWGFFVTKAIPILIVIQNQNQ